MARPIYYVFCRYSIDGDEGSMDEAGEFSFLAENQGGEQNHGRERDDGSRGSVLCTDPRTQTAEGRRSHVFEIGYKAGMRTRQLYDPATKAVVREIANDPHTKLGQVITVPSLRAMAVRDRASDDTLNAQYTLSGLRSLVRGASKDEWAINVLHATNEDVEHGLRTWRVSEYTYTVRPLNPTGGALARMRTAMHHEENIFQESGTVRAAPGQGLKMAEGVIGQTHDLVESGYGQNGIKGVTEDGQVASIPKAQFHQDKEKNIKSQENAPRFMKIAFDPSGDPDGNISLDVASALVRFYLRNEA